MYTFAAHMLYFLSIFDELEFLLKFHRYRNFLVLVTPAINTFVTGKVMGFNENTL